MEGQPATHIKLLHRHSKGVEPVLKRTSQIRLLYNIQVLKHAIAMSVCPIQMAFENNNAPETVSIDHAALLEAHQPEIDVAPSSVPKTSETPLLMFH